MIFVPAERGQGIVEYALIIVFIAIVVVVALAFFGTWLRDLYQVIASGI